MNCDSLHRRLLALEDVARPPADLRAHLAACPACREWYDKVLLVEREAARLPVPAPRAKSAFLERFVHAGGEAAAETSPALGSAATTPPTGIPQARPGPGKKECPPILRLPGPAARGGPRDRALPKVAVAVSLAAALLLVAFGIWAWPHRGPAGAGRTAAGEPQLSALDLRLKGDKRWEEADTARKKLDVLADLADKVQGGAQALARSRSTTDLAKEVSLFREVVERIQTEAPLVGREERVAVLEPIARRLAHVESQVGRVAGNLMSADPVAARELRELALVAQAGDHRLRALLRDAA